MNMIVQGDPLGIATKTLATLNRRMARSTGARLGWEMVEANDAVEIRLPLSQSDVVLRRFVRGGQVVNSLSVEVDGFGIGAVEGAEAERLIVAVATAKLQELSARTKSIVSEVEGL